MKALLDTNIIIHREASIAISQDIGTLYRWLEKGGYVKCIHQLTIDEIKKNRNRKIVDSFLVKMKSYERIAISSPLAATVSQASIKFDKTPNDLNDTLLLNEVFVGRVDILITEDRNIHKKAKELGISDKVFSIDAFLEKVFLENPDLVDYRVLSVKKVRFGELSLGDNFFDSLKRDYTDFEKWYLKKYDDYAYVTTNKTNGKLLSFLYLKIENENEIYADIEPIFKPKKRLKIGTFKVISNGFRLGERFLKIIFDNAIKSKVSEVYVTVFNHDSEQARLVELLKKWGFFYWGKKGEEEVYVRNMEHPEAATCLHHRFPYISRKSRTCIVPIYPEYHTELLPDSILNNESPSSFEENMPHRNCIEKAYVSRAYSNIPKSGDNLIFYRTGGYFKGVVTTIGVVCDVRSQFQDEKDFVKYCTKVSVFPENKLLEFWRYKQGVPIHVIRFLYSYSFPRRINMAKLINLGILRGSDDPPRGFRTISLSQFSMILRETKSDESFIID